MSHIIFNRQIIKQKDFQLSISNRAFLYGDGLFESVKILNGKAFNLDAHLKRLFSAALLMNLKIVASKNDFRNDIKHLLRENKIAEFPDAITSRGTKHLNELCNAKKKGYQSYILYLIQRENCDSFKIAKDIDEEYKIAFSKALKSGVKILCYDCKLNSEEIKLNKQINYEQ